MKPFNFLYGYWLLFRILRAALLIVAGVFVILASPLFPGEIPCIVGFLYDNGYGVSRDYSEAVKWYRKAAEQGSAEAQVALAFKYATGEGVEPNYIEACMWINIASARDKQKASEVLPVIEKYMTKEGIAEGHYLAYLWTLQHSKSVSYSIPTPAGNPYSHMTQSI